MTKINVSAHTAYHSQVNNAFYPLSSCNTTSAIMWMLDCHVPFKYPDGMQPEDHLTQITESVECYSYMEQIAPWAFRDGKPIIPARQVHACLSWAINKLAGREVAKFREDVTYQELVVELAKGRAAIVSGIFTRQGHVVCLVGVHTKQLEEKLQRIEDVRLDQIVGWIIDDPYGDYYSVYHDQHGNDCFFDYNEFDRLTRELYRNHKWAHLFIG
jgi:hypothetical protein